MKRFITLVLVAQLCLINQSKANVFGWILYGDGIYDEILKEAETNQDISTKTLEPPTIDANFISYIEKYIDMKLSAEPPVQQADPFESKTFAALQELNATLQFLLNKSQGSKNQFDSFETFAVNTEAKFSSLYMWARMACYFLSVGVVISLAEYLNLPTVCCILRMLIPTILLMELLLYGNYVVVFALAGLVVYLCVAFRFLVFPSYRYSLRNLRESHHAVNKSLDTTASRRRPNCSGTRADGSQCRNVASADSSFCWRHN